MANYSDLVDVSFQDATSHQSVEGNDVLGVLLPYHWGPVNKLKVYNRTEFYEAYPESLPLNKTLSEEEKIIYQRYAQVKKFFENGGAFVEIYRPDLGASYQGKTSGNYRVILKYPGALPSVFLPAGATKATIQLSENKVELVATVGSNNVVVESWDGQFADELKTEDGRYTHFIKVLEQSRLLSCVHKDDTNYSAFTEISDEFSSEFEVGGSESDLLGVYQNIFSDTEISAATMLISPFTISEFDVEVSKVASNIKTAVAVVGYPTTSDFEYEDILSYAGTFDDKFTIFVAGREIASIFGQKIQLNCVGGYCGALAKVAQTERLNQIASAKTYGNYIGILDRALAFSDVLKLHDKGVVSVYNSKTGPQLFGIHNTYFATHPGSYFSKSNVMRVTAAILRNILPICFESIHTDTAANPIARAIFESRCNSVINDMIANQNLQPDSYADASASINTDYLTKGGTELNLILNLHYIGLVEKVRIKVVATDSSVNAEII